MGLLLVIIGWVVASKIATKQVERQTKIMMDYEVYKNILSQVNNIINAIAHFSSGIDTHTKKMASLLNEKHSGDAISTERNYELIELWKTETESITMSGYKIEESIIDFMRSLDMSGTNFHSNTEVYKALQIVQKDASDAINSIILKWINLNLDGTTVPQYDNLKIDTQRDMKHVRALGDCIEDVLKLVFNDTLAQSTKIKKVINLNEHRKIITLAGLVDKRFG